METFADKHVIIGAGPVGQHLTRLLNEGGADVVVVTRSGTDTGIDGVKHVAADASDVRALTEIAQDAAVLFNCANPASYSSWPRVWPPLAAAMLSAAEQTQAVYAIAGNLYPYGPVDGPMIEGAPDAATDRKGQLRAAIWQEALQAHQAGRVRAVEVRSSDYVGAGVGENGIITRVIPAALRGKAVSVLDDAHQPHSFTDVADAARALAVAAHDERAWGKVWHAPTNPPRTQAEAITDILASVGKPPVRVRAIPTWVLGTLGVVWPLGRELRELSYQRTRPYVLDDAASRRQLGFQPTGWDEVCRRTAQG